VNAVSPAQKKGWLVKIATINRSESNRIELNRIELGPVGLARARWALYLALAAAWIIIALAQFMVDTANASNSSTAPQSIDEGMDESTDEWRPIPASIIG
jgi:hypothetical protein